MVKRAFVVGLSYKDVDGVTTLPSPPNAAKEFRDFLINDGKFPPENITYLSDEFTKSCPNDREILRKLCFMTRLGKPGDVLVFYFCGHGGCLPARNTKNNSSFIEYIATGPGPTSDGKITIIRDYTFREIVGTVPENCHFCMIVDACSSGALIEGAQEILGTSTANNSMDDENKEEPPKNGYIRIGPPSKRKLGILISACQSGESTGPKRKTKKKQAYFTDLFIRTKREMGKVSYRSLVQRLRDITALENKSQRPGLYCDPTQADLDFLSPEIEEPVPSLPKKRKRERQARGRGRGRGRGK